MNRDELLRAAVATRPLPYFPGRPLWCWRCIERTVRKPRDPGRPLAVCFRCREVFKRRIERAIELQERGTAPSARTERRYRASLDDRNLEVEELMARVDLDALRTETERLMASPWSGIRKAIGLAPKAVPWKPTAPEPPLRAPKIVASWIEAGHVGRLLAMANEAGRAVA